jgi:hypothetical protein
MASEDLTYNVSSKAAMSGQTTQTSSKDPKSTIEPNVLDKYASYNYIWTLSALSREELLNPNSITTNKPHDIIAKSGGIGTDGNYSPFNEKGKVANSSAVLSGTVDRMITSLKPKQLKEAENYNKILKRGHDIFFESVVIDGTNTANEQRKLMNFNKLEMQLTEPFGVTLFEKLRAAALNNGYRDHIDCPYLLTLDFRGYDNKGNSLGNVITTRYLPIKITDAEMEINQGGTFYTMTAVAWNEFALTDRFLYTRGTGGPYTKSKKDNEKVGIDKRASTLNGALKLLEENLNEQQKVEVRYGLRESENTLDQYVIDSAPGVYQFNGESSNSEIDDATVSGGYYKFSIRPNQSIAQVITDIVLQSDEYRNISKIVEKYWKDLGSAQELQGQITDEEFKAMIPDPMVPWFKIKTSIYNSETFDNVTKMHSKIIHFQVIPWKIHVMNFAVPGLSASKLWGKKVRKAYKYIYTGENNQIIDLKINYKYGFFQARLLDGSRSDAASSRDVKDLGLIAIAKRYGSRAIDFPEGLLPLRSYPSTLKNEDVSTDDAGSRTQVDEFMEYLTNPLADMVNVEMTIMGDPAFIGQENYLPIPRKTTSTEGGGGETTEQVAGYKGRLYDDKLGCFNFDQGEAFVTLDFRFPTDINEKKGVMDFQSMENVHFSGLYKVVNVVSEFKQGKFTQTLKMLRYNNQGEEINLAENIRVLTDYATKAESILRGVWNPTASDIEGMRTTEQGVNGP